MRAAAGLRRGKEHMKQFLRATILISLGIGAAACRAPAEEFLITSGATGNYGGDLLVAERSEPKTLNPLMAVDNVSREVIGLLMADLIHINRDSQNTEPALAVSVDISRDGRRYVVHLRRGVRFSDGFPFDADDVVFTFEVYLDAKIHAPQRDLLMSGGKPVVVREQDANTVIFEFAQPYGPGDRLFDTLYILPRHLLLKPYTEGKLNGVWDLNVAPTAVAGLGPFQFKQYVPGQRLVLEKNPYYWKQDRAGHRLPYVNRVVFRYMGSEDAEVLQFENGGVDIVSRLSARNFDAVSRHKNPSEILIDAGPSLEYDFLFFNLNDLTNRNLRQIQMKQAWFRDVRFRQAVSNAIDREAIVRLVFAGRATPIWSQVTPGNKLWRNPNVTPSVRLVRKSRALLASAGFSWSETHKLTDPSGRPVEFSIVASANNSERIQMATLIQQDLADIGIDVHIVALELRTMLDRITTTLDYDASLMGLASGDVDPGSEMSVWPSRASAHLWELQPTIPAPRWQTEIDKLMSAQMSSNDPRERKRLYDRVQELVETDLPIIPLISPHVLAGSKAGLRNFRPAVLLPYVLWNADELFWDARH
jgi:peptide/nickel transport system substrate-binding protein